MEFRYHEIFIVRVPIDNSTHYLAFYRVGLHCQTPNLIRCVPSREAVSMSEISLNKQKGNFHADEQTPLIQDESIFSQPAKDSTENLITSNSDAKISASDLHSSIDKTRSLSNQSSNSSGRRIRRTTSCVEIPEELIKVDEPCIPPIVKIILTAIVVLLMIALLIMASAFIAYEMWPNDSKHNSTVNLLVAAPP